MRSEGERWMAVVACAVMGRGCAISDSWCRVLFGLMMASDMLTWLNVDSCSRERGVACMLAGSIKVTAIDGDDDGVGDG
jgi:hypothetical protein